MSVYEEVKAHLRDGGYGPGERIPAHPELADRLSVALSAVERAVARLKSEGLIVTGYFGTYVSLARDGNRVTVQCEACNNEFEAPGRDWLAFRRTAADLGWEMREGESVQFRCSRHSRLNS